MQRFCSSELSVRLVCVVFLYLDFFLLLQIFWVLFNTADFLRFHCLRHPETHGSPESPTCTHRSVFDCIFFSAKNPLDSLNPPNPSRYLSTHGVLSLPPRNSPERVGGHNLQPLPPPSAPIPMMNDVTVPQKGIGLDFMTLSGFFSTPTLLRFMAGALISFPRAQDS